MAERIAVNPWAFGLMYGFNQGINVRGAREMLFLAGQASVDGNGTPLHIGDMAGQLAQALDNVEAVLKEAGMDLGAVVRLNVYTTDVDSLRRHYSVLTDRLAAAGAAPPGTLLGVAQLGVPEIMVELEATAVA